MAENRYRRTSDTLNHIAHIDHNAHVLLRFFTNYDYSPVSKIENSVLIYGFIDFGCLKYYKSNNFINKLINLNRIFIIISSSSP